MKAMDRLRQAFQRQNDADVNRSTRNGMRKRQRPLSFGTIATTSLVSLISQQVTYLDLSKLGDSQSTTHTNTTRPTSRIRQRCNRIRNCSNSRSRSRSTASSGNSNRSFLRLLLLLLVCITKTTTALLSTTTNRVLQAEIMMPTMDPFAQDDENTFRAIHCSHPAGMKHYYNSDAGNENGNVGPLLQECHPMVMANDLIRAVGTVCVQVVPSIGNQQQVPALQLSVIALQDASTATTLRTFLEHNVWIGESLQDVPRQEDTGAINYAQFPVQWNNSSTSSSSSSTTSLSEESKDTIMPTNNYWQSQLDLNCQDKSQHTFYVVIRSLVHTTTITKSVDHQEQQQQQQERDYVYAFEKDGQGAGDWYGWMEVQVDCECSIPQIEHNDDLDQTLLSTRSGTGTTTYTATADVMSFHPYSESSCQGPDLFRLLPNDHQSNNVDTSKSTWNSPVCWDIIDTQLHTPMGRVCIDITDQDEQETEITVSFSSIGYAKLTKTSFWAGIHSDRYRIADLPFNPDDGSLKLEELDQFFYDPKGLPDITHEFYLPTDICTNMTSTEIPETKDNRRAQNRDFLQRHLGMSLEGVISIPLVAYSESMSTTPEGTLLGTSAGYVYQYLQVNDRYEFGSMELQLQCGCSRTQQDEALRRRRSFPASSNQAAGYGNNDAVQGADNQEVLPESNCRAAFAYATSKPETIHTLSDLGYNVWGYTNGPYASSSSSIKMDFYEKMSYDEDMLRTDDDDNNQERQVGTLQVFFDGDDAEVTFSMEETFPLYTTHIYVGTSPLPSGVNNVALSNEKDLSNPLLFDFSSSHIKNAIVNPYSDSYTISGFDYGDTVYVMAYATDCANSNNVVPSQPNSNIIETFEGIEETTDTACLRSYSDCYSLMSHVTSGSTSTLSDFSVGQVCFAMDDSQDNLEVRYSLSEEWSLVAAHAWIGATLMDLPTLQDRTPDLARFLHQETFGQQSQSWKETLPLFRKEQCAASTGGSFDIVAVAHALVGAKCQNGTCVTATVPGTEQHAYAEETLLQRRGNWFYYVDMTVDCHCGDGSWKTSMPPVMTPTTTTTSAPTDAPSQHPSYVPTTAPTKQINVTNTCIYTPDGVGEYCLLLFAPDAWETNAGSVCLTIVDGVLAVIYDINSYWSLAEANIWVGSDVLDVPVKNDGEPDVSAFPYFSDWSQEGKSTFVKVVNLDGMTQEQCKTKGAYDIFIVAHGLVAEPAVSPTSTQPFVPFSEEDAYAKAHPFSDTSKASYIAVSVICDCDAYNNQQL